MASKIYYITGGERSGKSSYAQQLALSLSDRPSYVATAKSWDADFEKRIARHKNDRDERWNNVEEKKYLHRAVSPGSVAVVDCVTLWLTNIYIDHRNDIDKCLKDAREIIDQLIQIDCTLIIISNEIGMGLHANTAAGRSFVELQGWVNQYISQKSHQAIFMVSGIPILIKDTWYANK